MLTVFGRLIPMMTVGLVVLAACGGTAVSFMSSTAIERAEAELRGARQAKADELAPYEYTKADLYIRMSKERLGFADYQAAQRFAEDALEIAGEARKNAAEARRLKSLKEGNSDDPDRRGWGPIKGESP